MILVRVLLVILIPILALFVLAFSHIYVENHAKKFKGKQGKSEEQSKEVAYKHHQKTLVEYLQSSRTGDLVREEEMEIKDKHEDKEPG